MLCIRFSFPIEKLFCKWKKKIPKIETKTSRCEAHFLLKKITNLTCWMLMIELFNKYYNSIKQSNNLKKGYTYTLYLIGNIFCLEISRVRPPCIPLFVTTNNLIKYWYNVVSYSQFSVSYCRLLWKLIWRTEKAYSFNHGRNDEGWAIKNVPTPP